MSTYPVSGEKMPEHELHWIPNLFCTCILLTSVYKPLSLSCISQQVTGPSTNKRYEREGSIISIHFLLFAFLSLSLPFSPCHKFGWFLAISMSGWYKKGRRRGMGRGRKVWEGKGLSLSFYPYSWLFPFLSLPSSPYQKSGWSFTISVGGWHKRGRGEEGGKVWEGKRAFLLLLSLPFRLLPHKLQ